jgi:hypothetical protein
VTSHQFLAGSVESARQVMAGDEVLAFLAVCSAVPAPA